MLCPKCSKEVSPTGQYCPHCGAQVASSANTSEGADLGVPPAKSVWWRGRWAIAGVAALVGLVFAAAFGLGTYFILRSASGESGQAGATDSPGINGGSAASTTLPPREAGEDPHRGGVLTYALGAPDGLDPLNVWESQGTQVAQCLFDSLVAFDPETGAVLPAAATSWESEDDGSVWVFHLVEGARFHDGSPVTAADFKYAWERICDPDNGSRISYHLSAIQGYEAMRAGTADSLEGVETLDDHTLRVTLSYRFADFPQVTGHPSLAPVPRQAVEADPAAYADMPIGNGPFRLARPWEYDYVIDLIRFDDYYGQVAHLDGVEFQIPPDEETAYVAFQNGELDFSPIPQGELEAASSAYGVSEDGRTVTPGGQVLAGPTTSIEYVFLNTRDDTLSDVKIRQALSLAIDRQALSDALYEGSGQAATSIVPAGIAGYVDGAWPYARYDLAAAREALADAGYPEGRGLPPIYVHLPTGASDDSQLFTLIADHLAEVGVTLTIQEVDYPQYLRRLENGTFMMDSGGWIADYPIIDDFLYPLFATGSDDNQSLYSDLSFDQAVAEARATMDYADRLAKYQAIVAAVGEAVPVIPLVQYNHRSVGAERLRDFVLDQMGLAHLESAWLAGGGLTPDGIDDTV
jgi:oligopeptide transport system substrate-binding protein